MSAIVHYREMRESPSCGHAGPTVGCADCHAVLMAQRRALLFLIDRLEGVWAITQGPGGKLAAELMSAGCVTVRDAVAAFGDTCGQLLHDTAEIADPNGRVVTHGEGIQ